jgi:predicted phage-related endonuclease
MSMQIEKGVKVLDDNTAQWLKQYREALAKIKEWEEVADIARSHLENALGDCEEGLHNGQTVVRWTAIESKRFDTKRAREILPPQVIEMLEVVSHSRRFSVVDTQ